MGVSSIDIQSTNRTTFSLAKKKNTRITDKTNTKNSRRQQKGYISPRRNISSNKLR